VCEQHFKGDWELFRASPNYGHLTRQTCKVAVGLTEDEVRAVRALRDGARGKPRCTLCYLLPHYVHLPLLLASRWLVATRCCVEI